MDAARLQPFAPPGGWPRSRSPRSRRRCRSSTAGAAPSVAKWRSKSSSGRGTAPRDVAHLVVRDRPRVEEERAAVEARAGPPRPGSPPRPRAGRRWRRGRSRGRSRCSRPGRRPGPAAAIRAMRPGRSGTGSRYHRAPRRPHAVNFGAPDAAHRLRSPGPAHLQAGRDQQDRRPPHPRPGEGAGGGQGRAGRRSPGTGRRWSR